ncbi:MAG: elongation factor 1-beta family protein [Candidatus Micrarchaeia archaeon]
MADVIVRAKIYPEESESIPSIEKEIRNILRVGEIKIIEIGFGIKLIQVSFLAREDEGLEASEQKINSIAGVRQVEIESVDRALG